MNDENTLKLLARLCAHELVIRDLLVLRFIGAPDPIKALEVFGANLAPTRWRHSSRRSRQRSSARRKRRCNHSVAAMRPDSSPDTRRLPLRSPA